MAQFSVFTTATVLSAIVASAASSGAQGDMTDKKVECGTVIDFQVLLARQRFSPGEIDGVAGLNFSRAVAAFQEARDLDPSGAADCVTWQALGGAGAAPTTVKYRVSAADAEGPFTEAIPSSLPDQAALPSLGYTSLIELLAERFQTSPKTLQRLNQNVNLTADVEIAVPAVEPFHISPERPRNQERSDVVVIVRRDDSSLRVVRPDGSLVFFAPVTTGSEHDPLPVGDWTVTGVSWLPVFHYNPDLFWDARPNTPKATLKPGPNSPVGVVWIDLNVDHFGIHGTPEPQRVGHAESHGCVRMTNWDAARLAALVGPGTPVQFR
jgi:lipoprotein-anchoring transpeptidase ErfK/SrfK